MAEYNEHTCGECIHSEICENLPTLTGWDALNPAYCRAFRNAVDAVEVVRCKDCKYGIWDEEEGLWMCVFDADYDEELGVYHGFIQYNTADYYCADGKRRSEVASEVMMQPKEG